MRVNAHLDVDHVAVQQTDQVTIMLELLAPEERAGAERRPAAVQVVLDRSGSMDGPRLLVARRSSSAVTSAVAYDLLARAGAGLERVDDAERAVMIDLASDVGSGSAAGAGTRRRVERHRKSRRRGRGMRMSRDGDGARRT